MRSSVFHLDTLDTLVCRFIGCTKILSAFTWLQKSGMLAMIKAPVSCLCVEEIGSRSGGKTGSNCLLTAELTTGLEEKSES
jgi:hypothetical protein